MGLALLIAGVGFWALETHHPRELCGPPRPTGQCAVETRGIVSKEYVEAVALQTEQAEASALGHRDFRWAGCCTAMGADGAEAPVAVGGGIPRERVRPRRSLVRRPQ